MGKKIILYSYLTGKQKLNLYYQIRDDVSMLLCAMGDICDLHEHQKEYDILYEDLAKNLVMLDRMYKEEFSKAVDTI